MSRSACGQWERGAAAPSVVRLIHLAKTLDVNFEWLATGRGEVEFVEPGIHESPAAYARRQQTRQAQELLELFNSLPTAAKEALLALLRAMV